MAKRKPKSPTARTLQEMRKLGYQADVVERWIAAIKQRKDLFGFIDVLAIKGETTVAIQSTTGNHHAERVAKILAHPNFPACIAAGWVVEVHSWTKAGGKGKRKLWECRKEEITVGGAFG